MQYVALLMMVARHVGLKPGVFMHVVDNLHIYDRHIEQAKELLSRTPSEKQPKLILKEGKTNFYIPCYGAFPFTLMHTAEIPTQTPHIRHRTVFSTLHVA